ncbi:exodeoxyribonuclease VII large subunit [Halalkalibacillus sediminis]|uniref:Exodeoxyribonuclease 7 large subunit n=1 Tax=Halalkalibacillus sediminis TaxID=2018042 RepID=A0A2I0QX90_9BACI|nr:exodeoxyribonuclease VII large subunit [Halalkalibacillus sediminis]PKR78952.1 exodeoxyribonuclease VII large subunit [Halalkalibacillus sediminis]
MQEKYLTVTALTKYIKRKIETDKHLKNVWLQAEISNFNLHSRGHMYFTLKDQGAKISAVMFASDNQRLKFTPENGTKVILRGDIGLYEPQGQYQIYVRDMQPDGIGALYLAYEELKKKLTSEGLFEDSRKLPIQAFPNHIAIITSPTGAAVRDIITTLKRRYPSAKRTIIPVSVQGKNAAPSIAEALKKANSIESVDTIIIGRGGGSIEELWAFNEEIVARAIEKSHKPIISAVGHETDFTISDFVADLRAPTPTAAAELAVPSIEELKKTINQYTHRLHHEFKSQLMTHKERIQSLRNSYAFKYPAHLTRQKEQDLDRLVVALSRSSNQLIENRTNTLRTYMEKLKANRPDHLIREKKRDVHELHKKMDQTIQTTIDRNEHRFSRAVDKLMILNPLETMKRGYSITYGDKGEVIKSTDQVKTGDDINLTLQDGFLSCKVKDVEKGDVFNDK